MATAFEGEAVINTTSFNGQQAGAGNTVLYTVPAGRYARVWITASQSVGTGSTAIAGKHSYVFQTTGEQWGPIVGGNEMLLISGETVSLTSVAATTITGGGSAIEYTNP